MDNSEMKLTENLNRGTLPFGKLRKKKALGNQSFFADV